MAELSEIKMLAAATKVVASTDSIWVFSGYLQTFPSRCSFLEFENTFGSWVSLEEAIPTDVNLEIFFQHWIFSFLWDL